MKKYLIMTVIVALIVALTLLYLGAIQGISLDLFDATKYSSFRIGMSEQKAKSLFEGRGELISTSEVEIMGQKTRSLTYATKEGLKEQLQLSFAGDQLYAFSYQNWEMQE